MQSLSSKGKEWDELQKSLISPFLSAVIGMVLISSCLSGGEGTGGVEPGAAPVRVNVPVASSKEVVSPTTKSADPVAPVAQVADPKAAYVIRAGDLLSIWVFRQPDLTLKARVTPTGRIHYPFVGEVDVLGKSPEKVARVLAGNRNLLRQVNQPMISVSVEEYAPMAIFVLGAVVRPQRIELTLDPPMTLTQAIAQAEGFRPDAARTRVRIFRRNADKATTSVDVNVARILDQNRPGDDIVLRPGDTVFVAPRVTGGVFVLGAVARAGFFELKDFHKGGEDDPITVTQAIAAAGGMTEDAIEDRVRLFRSRAGTGGGLADTVVREIDVAGILKRNKPGQDESLAAGDTVYVPSQDKVFVIGRVLKAGAYSSPKGHILTVTKAISLAGGFDKYADRTEVKLFRRSSLDGKPVVVDVKKMFSSGDMRQDPEVRPGDLIFVPESAW